MPVSSLTPIKRIDIDKNLPKDATVGSNYSPSPSTGVRIHDPVDDAAELDGTPILLVSFDSGAEFLDALGPGGPAGELILDTRARPPAHGEVVVEIDWPGLPNPAFVRAQARRRINRPGLIARLHPDERLARDYLVAVASGGPVECHRRFTDRYAVHLPLNWRAFGTLAATQGWAHDLSSGGALVETDAEPPPLGEQVVLRLVPSAGHDLVVTGIMRHREPRGAHWWFGVQFACRASGEQRRLRHLLRVFAARGVVILQP
jgi:hypothetical protein